ncbi:hypothetical protein MLD38_027918 [Melastoma candidum]|uniref:Uncharacterized protein n=1 Tax=Melastoma candidum TaxID=119954 RepID=A0ACB9N5I1_9MYRT|nr:hypothetical protein MLD38_027918 [Melastoma candidum]
MDQGRNLDSQFHSPPHLQGKVYPEDKRTADELSAVCRGTKVSVQGRDVIGLLSPSKISAVPLPRQFWKAGSCDSGFRVDKVSVQDGENYAHVHPMFLHSNATSHKWVFGAIAELLDNAIDEIQNGATLVLVDRTVSPRDGSPALLIQDDGGGMGPEALRHCMSFGFSDKRSKAAIGQYGNGFKTSTMRLGADVVVFSRHKGDRGHSQSIGLLSYTFLTRTGCNRIVVPMVDYEFDEITRTVGSTHLYNSDYFDSNLSLILKWSPYSTEADLLKQFDDIGSHGTKVIIFNLWLTDGQIPELDFDSDPTDICIGGDMKKVTSKPQWKPLNERHIANRLHYSLRVYLSILYLRLPDSFMIILRGQAVERHNIADDLKHIEYILYRPQSGGTVEGEVVTTIGFLKEAPNVSIDGFNIYHKNRLILVSSRGNGRGLGVVGVLETNFIEPTHNKQDFERTSLFQKLEVRLKEMAKEYWYYHCGLIGYQVRPKHLMSEPLGNGHNLGSNLKRKAADLLEIRRERQLAGAGDTFLDELGNPEIGAVYIDQNQWGGPDAESMIEEHRKLRTKCVEVEKSEQELRDKLAKLGIELENTQKEYAQLLAKSRFLERSSKRGCKY